MATPNSRQSLKEYALRRLGKPTIEINVSDDQLEDRIDDAFALFSDYHYDAISRTYLAHQVTPQDQINQYFEIDESIISVVKMFSLSTQTMNMFDIRYQVRLNDFYNFNNVSMIHYTMTRNHLALLDFLFNTMPTIEFNRHMHQIALTGLDWYNDIQVGQYIVLECWAIVNPDLFTDIFNDRWLKDYVTALFKRQWGENLKKYGGIQLPGGVILNGQTLFDEAFDELKVLREQVETEYQLPIEFFMGGLLPFIFLLPHMKIFEYMNNYIWKYILSLIS